MLIPTPQRTDESLREAPVPSTDDVTTCVLEMGAAKTNAMTYNRIDALVWAANALGGSSAVIRRPSVRMMRYPPA